jgi:hypothetical protein
LAKIINLPGAVEFALTFGNFNVQMTVPADHVVGSTGECLNYAANLTPAQLERWKKAQTSREPVEIVTLAEAKAAEKRGNEMIASASPRKKTWIYKAENVRDFAWTSSPQIYLGCDAGYCRRKEDHVHEFLWKRSVMVCIVLFPRKQLRILSRPILSLPSPTLTPVAQSVEASNGMEYPMICFNYGRTEKDGTYSEGTKYGMLGVINS